MKTYFTGKFAAFFLLFFSGLLSFSANQVRAQEGPGDVRAQEQEGQGDPPTRVARISGFDGSVSVQPGGTGDWGAAVRNRPLTIGDKLWSDRDSRVELRAGQASIHLGNDTALSFLNLDQGITQIRLSEGSLNFRVRELREGDLYEIDTPNLAFTVRQAGAFRIDVNENGDSTSVTAIRGEGEVTSGGNTYPVRSGDRAEFTGTDQIQYNVDRAPEPDDLDRWASDRDLKEDNAVSSRYVSRDMSGYDDLDDYGDWRDVPEYGHVWYPRSVGVGWAPYSVGYWSWVGPWGWTWVDTEPWGFAPYHYGRWAYVGGGWGWCPGPLYAEPIYGPAFVGFLGGGGWGVGIGFGGGFGYGGLGWFPLGFGEPYCPWYRHGGNYLRNVNISNTYIHNTTIINNGTINNYNYAYAHNVNAVTTTTHNNFVNGTPVNRGEAHLTAASLRGAQVTTKIAASPTKASYGGSANVGKHVATPPTSVINRPVVARTAPAAASHEPVHTVNASTLTPGREVGRAANSSRPTNGPNPAVNSRGPGSTPSLSGRAPVTQSAPLSGRQRELSMNRPPSAARGMGRPAAGSPAYGGPRNNSNLSTPPMDRARPNGINNAAPSGRATNRPPWAGSSRSDAGVNGNRSYNPPTRTAPNYDNGARGNRSYSAPQRPAYNGSAPNGNRSYSPPQHNAPSSQPRSYSPPVRSQSAPSSNYSPAPRSYSPPARNDSRSYSAPSRSYSAPSRSNSAPAPSRSYSAPSRSYSAPAPSHSYSAPSRSSSAPSHSAPAPHSTGNGGGSRSADNRGRH